MANGVSAGLTRIWGGEGESRSKIPRLGGGEFFQMPEQEPVMQMRRGRGESDRELEPRGMRLEEP